MEVAELRSALTCINRLRLRKQGIVQAYALSNSLKNQVRRTKKQVRLRDPRHLYGTLIVQRGNYTMVIALFSSLSGISTPIFV